MVDEHRCREDVDKEPGEAERSRGREQQKSPIDADVAIGRQQGSGCEGISGAPGVRFGQETQTGEEQERAKRREKPEVCAPAKPGLEPAADDRRHRRRNREDHHYLRHQALCFVAVVAVTYDGAPDDHPDARQQSLQGAEEKQRANARCQRASDRGERVARNPHQNRQPPTKRVGHRAMKEHHACVREQIRRKRLLHVQRRGLETMDHRRKRRQVSID